MNFKLLTLKNSLRLVTIPLKGIESVTVLIEVAAGSRYETLKTNGISHFFEHMLFKGTKKRPTALDVASTIDSIGGEFNGHTSKESTGFYVKLENKHFPLALELLSDILTNSLFDPREIKKEKGVIIEEINMHEDIPMAKVGDVFDTLLYGKTPLGWRILGKKENIKRIKRNDFLSYMNHFYQPENMVIGIAGAIPKLKTKNKELKTLVEKYFGKLKTRRTKLKTPRLTFFQVEPQVKIEYKKTEQAHFCLGVRAIKRSHPDRYVLGLMSTILGGNMSSRLFTEVREKRGLAYYIRTSTARFEETGDLLTQAGTDINKIGETIKVVLEEYSKVQSSKFKVQNEELKKAKEFLKGRLALGLEDSHFVASLYAESLLLENKIKTPEEIIKGIEKVTVDDLLRLAKKIFLPKNLNLAIIGPYKNERQFDSLLKKF